MDIESYIAPNLTYSLIHIEKVEGRVHLQMMKILRRLKRCSQTIFRKRLRKDFTL
jgi:hypothetical protein